VKKVTVQPCKDSDKTGYCIAMSNMYNTSDLLTELEFGTLLLKCFLCKFHGFYKCDCFIIGEIFLV
jgi:hypothetical protein